MSFESAEVSWGGLREQAKALGSNLTSCPQASGGGIWERKAGTEPGQGQRKLSYPGEFKEGSCVFTYLILRPG